MAEWAAEFDVKETKPMKGGQRKKNTGEAGGLTETFREVGLLVNKDLGRDDGAKWLECLAEVGVREFLG